MSQTSLFPRSKTRAAHIFIACCLASAAVRPASAQNYSRASASVYNPSFPLTCSPCSVPAQQTTTIKFSFNVPSTTQGLANTNFNLMRVVPGRPPVPLANLHRDGSSNTNVSYSAAVPITEPQPGSFSVVVYGNTLAVSTPSTIRVLAPQQTAKHSSSGGWGAFFGGLLSTVVANEAAKDSGNQQQNIQPPATNTLDNPQPLVRSADLTFNIPAGYVFHSEIADNGGPLSLRNFDRYLKGGVVPMGGAEIEVTSVLAQRTAIAANRAMRVPSASLSMDSLVRAETNAASVTPFVVDRVPAQLAAFTDAFAPGFSYESQTAYVSKNGRIYKFFLTFNSGDPAAPAFHQAFSSVLTSTHFTAQ